MYNPYVSGKTVYLRAPTIEDAEGSWHEWLSDENTTRWLSLRHFPNTAEKQKFFLEQQTGEKNKIVLSIVDIATERHIGVCSLGQINWVHRHCDVAIIMGDTEFRKGQPALESMSLLLRSAFLRLNMRKVLSTYADANKSSEALNKVFGFREVGRMPDMFWDRGTYVDVVITMLDFETWIRRNSLEQT